MSRLYISLDSYFKFAPVVPFVPAIPHTNAQPDEPAGLCSLPRLLPQVWVPGIVRVKVDEDGDTTVRQYTRYSDAPLHRLGTLLSSRSLGTLLSSRDPLRQGARDRACWICCAMLMLCRPFSLRARTVLPDAPTCLGTSFLCHDDPDAVKCFPMQVKVGPLGSLLTVNAEGPRPGGPGPGPLPGPLPLPGPGPNPAAAVGGAFGGAFGAAVAGPVGGVAGTAIGQAVGGAVGGALATDGPQLGGGGLGGDWGPVVRSNGVHEGTAVDLGDFGELAGLGGSGGAGDRPAVAAATAATAATAAATASGLVEAIPPGAGTTSPFLLQQSAQEQQQGNAAVPAGATHGLRSGGGDNISLDLPGAVPLPGTAAILDTNRQQQLIRHNEQQAGPELPVPAGVPKAEEPKRNVAVSVGPGGSLFRSRSTATGRTDVDVLGGLAVGVSSSELTGRTVTTVGPAGSIARVVATDK